ncbi:substrate-binding periplasmic protein [Chitinimonas arctica]|uniref:substrate-binding periplasmic protein n=1 Tax=Chitinimonas arctica TaxID=2594795 RepID=UPI0015D262E8|nr:transporter substrate-binding domain-containing protein [Chitinimonas arctica]
MITTEYPPYCASDLPEQGVFTALTQAAFKAAGYDSTVLFRPWARALAEARTGQHDALLAVWYQAEREKYLVFTDPLWTNQIGFFGRVEQAGLAVQPLSGLKRYRIGVVRGYANPPEFDAADLTTDLSVDDLFNLKKLLAGRVDLALIDKTLADYLIRSKLPEAAGKLIWREPPVATMPLYVAIPRSRPDYRKRLADFNRGLAEIRRNGEYDRIVKRHAAAQ